MTQIAVASDPTNGPLIGEVAADGTAWVQGGSLTGGWTQVPYTGVTQIAVASDAANGPLIGVIANGTAYVEEGGLSGTWVQETGGGTVGSAAQLVLASDTANGPLIGVVDASGNAWVKDGGLSTNWVQQYSGGVTSLALASDSVNGPLIGVLSNNTAYFKEGSLSAGWGFVGTSGAATALAVASDPVNGPLIGVIHAGNAYAKQGSLTATWTLAYSGVTSLALADDSTNGPLIGVTDTDNTAWAEQGGLSGGWVEQYPNVGQLALGSDTAHGPLIGIVAGSESSADIDGDAHVKQGGLNAAWADETPGADAPPDLSGAFVIDSAGSPGQLLCAEDGTQNVILEPIADDIEADCLWQQSGPDNDGFLYNPSQNMVLDINLSTSPIPSGTSVNLQPYYTDPVQSYEQFSWSGQTGYGGRSLQPINDTSLNLNATGLTLTGWDTNGTDPAQMSWTKVDVSDDSYPPVTMPANPNPPPSLAGEELIQDDGTPGYVLCADPATSGTETLPLSQSINPYCLWQQSGPDNDAYLYNPAVDAVLDVNSSSSLAAGTTTNLQPYYTDPLQSYEQWSLSSQNAYGGQTIAPVDNTALDLNAATTATPFVPLNSAGQNTATGTWTILPVTVATNDGSYPIRIRWGADDWLSGGQVSFQFLCGPGGAALNLKVSNSLGGVSGVGCAWARVAKPGGAIALQNSNGTWLTYNGTASAVNLQSQSGGTNQLWTLGGMESWGAQAIRPYSDVTRNLNGTSCDGFSPPLNCIYTTTWNSWWGNQASTWAFVNLA